MIEVQIHPGDLRKRVRHLVLGRRALLAGIVLGTFLLGFLVLSMVAAPSVIRRTYRSSALKEARQEKAIQLERLREHVRQMHGLERLVDERKVDIDKLATVYGVEMASSGTGGQTAGTRQSESELPAARSRARHLAGSMSRLQKQLVAVQRFELENGGMIRQTPAILPIPADNFVLSSPWGWRISPFTKASDFHAGIDLAAPAGTPVYATADGVVVFAGRHPQRNIFWWRFGNVVAVRHGDRYVTIYGHCDRLDVKKGQTVRQGEAIGTVGTSGWTTHAHLHYEVRSNVEGRGWDAVDPRIYILNYQWNNEKTLLSEVRAGKRGKPWEPLPAPFTR